MTSGSRSWTLSCISFNGCHAVNEVMSNLVPVAPTHQKLSEMVPEVLRIKQSKAIPTTGICPCEYKPLPPRTGGARAAYCHLDGWFPWEMVSNWGISIHLHCWKVGHSVAFASLPCGTKGHVVGSIQRFHFGHELILLHWCDQCHPWGARGSLAESLCLLHYLVMVPSVEY